ncbi:MAG TPA: RNA polymerase-binding protein DksA, partial [Burkholderiaceae bacterium]|nr:RNA polymerase-binding protein DksA [Burkholderiaceae bacterium]
MAATKEKKPLTEAELLKMPDSDYMNEAQLAFFRQRLQQMEKDLLANADETTEHLRETVIVPDPADRATIEEEHAL